MAAQTQVVPCDVIVQQPVCDPAVVQVCVHVVVNSRKFETIPKSTLHALVPTNFAPAPTTAKHCGVGRESAEDGAWFLATQVKQAVTAY